MNLGTTIAVYATLCKREKLPFIFPGSKMSYEGLVDVTDSELLAEHLYWQMTSPQAANLAYNVVNGDNFRWKYFWPVIAQYFQLEPAPYTEPISPMEPRMSKYEKEWETITKEYNLAPFKLNQVASWWHTDADLGRNFECVNDMNRSKELGWTGFRNSQKSFLKLFDRLREEKIIPPK